MVYKNKNLH